MAFSAILAVGLILVWTGERIVGTSSSRAALTALGTLMVLAAFVLRLVKCRRLRLHGGGYIHNWLLGLYGLVLLSLLLYGIQSDIWTSLTGNALESTHPRLAGALAALWPAFMASALLPTCFIEVSLRAMQKAPTPPPQRMREALFAGLSVAFVLILAFSTQYVVSAYDARVDFSYARATQASETTKRFVASLDEEMHVYLFYPPGSTSVETLVDYFKGLQHVSAFLNVTVLDFAFEPAKAKALGVTANGTVLLQKGTRTESLSIPVALDKAHQQMRALDAKLQRKLLKVTRTKRTVYFTAGHGEPTRKASEGGRRGTLGVLYKTLESNNFIVRTLSIAEGLSHEVPEDAAAVFILGPSNAFSQPEHAALTRYMRQGGRLFIAMDPEKNVPVTIIKLLETMGLTFRAQYIAQERGIVTLHPPPSLADRVNIATRIYATHPAVTRLKNTQTATLFAGAGSLETLPQPKAQDTNAEIVVHSMPDSWNDTNRNFEFNGNAGEVRKAYGLVAAVTQPKQPGAAIAKAQALVLADSDCISDALLPLVLGNQYFIVDGLKWLLEDAQLLGATDAAEGVPLMRNRQTANYWFYGTTFLAPLLVLALGFFAYRKTKKPTTKAKPEVNS